MSGSVGLGLIANNKDMFPYKHELGIGIKLLNPINGSIICLSTHMGEGH